MQNIPHITAVLNELEFSGINVSQYIFIKLKTERLRTSSHLKAAGRQAVKKPLSLSKTSDNSTQEFKYKAQSHNRIEGYARN